MLKPPAHKSGTAGQITKDVTLKDYINRKSFDRHPYLKNSNAEPWPYPPEEQKLSFKEWWKKNHLNFHGQSVEAAKLIWQAAQENK